MIAHVVYRFAMGGLENGLVNLLNHLPEDRWRHSVIALEDVCEQFRQRVRRQDVEYIALNKGPGHLVRHYPRLVRLFKRLRPDILHTRNLAALEATVPGWAAGVRARVHGEHGWDTHDSDGSSVHYQRVRRLYSGFVHRYVALSLNLKRYLERNVGVSAERITQIYNGVDTLTFHPRRSSQPVPADLPFRSSNLWLVGTVGRLQSIKDPVNLVQAFMCAVRQDSGAARSMRLVMIGDGPLREEVQAMLRQAGLLHHAWLPGARSDIPDVLRALDCFALPSRSEGISNAILEAMASGLPIVATAVGGNAELLDDGVTGTLVPAHDSRALGDALLAYFRNRERAAQHAAAACHGAQTRFSLTRMVHSYDQLYAELLGPRHVQDSAALVARR
jgi:sugar transferase (PEP-CTERM/EpsH1 system associated)